MKILSNILLAFLLSGFLTSPVVAQTDLEEDTRSIEGLLGTLDKDIKALRRLMAEIDASDSSDREVLVYRQDERVFRLLADYDALAGKVVSLPDESEERLASTAQLTGFGIDLGPAIFDRVSQIKQSVNQQKVQFSELSGATRVAAQAYVVSLESIRILYYEGLANHILSREALGLPPENVREQLGLKLYMYAEILAGRIEFTAAAQIDGREEFLHGFVQEFEHLHRLSSAFVWNS